MTALPYEARDGLTNLICLVCATFTSILLLDEHPQSCWMAFLCVCMRETS